MKARDVVEVMERQDRATVRAPASEDERELSEKFPRWAMRYREERRES